MSVQIWREELEFSRRFCGPPDSGNGGYVCGRLAGYLDGVVEVTLRKPPPLGRGLEVRGKEGEGYVELWDQGVLIASASSSSLSLEVPTPPTYEQAVVCSRSYAGFVHHVFPSCFVCGTAREEGDGLRIFAGQVDGREEVAAPWIPDVSLADESGVVEPCYMWAAMDCPGAYAVGLGEDRLVVLGRLTAELLGPLHVGERCVVLGWPLGQDGKKYFAGTALFNEAGVLCGRARATWIGISPDAFGAISSARD